MVRGRGRVSIGVYELLCCSSRKFVYQPVDGSGQEVSHGLGRDWSLIQRSLGSDSACILCIRTRTESPIIRDFLFRKIVFPSNVLERSDGRGKTIGALDVVAAMSALALGRG